MCQQCDSEGLSPADGRQGNGGIDACGQASVFLVFVCVYWFGVFSRPQEVTLHKLLCVCRVSVCRVSVCVLKDEEHWEPQAESDKTSNASCNKHSLPHDPLTSSSKHPHRRRQHQSAILRGSTGVW